MEPLFNPKRHDPIWTEDDRESRKTPYYYRSFSCFFTKIFTMNFKLPHDILCRRAAHDNRRSRRSQTALRALMAYCLWPKELDFNH